MANVIISPNMGLPVPTVGIDVGPDWSTNINSCLSAIDSHNHSSGSGVQISSAGININSDLPFNNNNAAALRSVRFIPQSAALALATDIGCIYEVGVDLYYNDGNGNQIRITQAGSVTGASGTITGLPSGMASASFGAGTFTFQSATATPATMAVGPLIVGNSVANSKTVTIAPNVSIAANYNFTLPASLPATLNYMTLDNSGNVGFNSAGYTGSDAVVLATSPIITSPTVTGLLTVSSSGVAFSSGTMIDYQEGSWVPTFTNLTNLSAINVDGIARFQRVGNIVTCRLSFTGTSLSAGSSSFRMTLPILPNNNWTTFSQAQGVLQSNQSLSGLTSALSGSKLVIQGINGFASSISFSFVSCVFIYYLNN